MALSLKSFVAIGKDGRPIFTRMPTPEEIALIKPTDKDGIAILYQLKSLLGMKSPSQIAAAQAKYLEGFNIVPGNPLYQQQLLNLNSAANSNRVMVATARRVSAQAEIQEATAGNPNQRFIRVAEGPDPCEPCVALDGEEGTLAEFEANNAIPGDQCYGAGNCLCRLYPYQ